MDDGTSWRRVAGRLASGFRAVRLHRRPYRLDLPNDPRSSIAREVEDVAAIAGAVGAGRPGDSFLAVRGSLGWARWDTDQPESKVRSEHPSWKVAPERTARFTLPTVGGYGGSAGRESIRSFISSFREGSPPMFDVTDARRVLEMIDAAHNSSESGRRVAIR